MSEENKDLQGSNLEGNSAVSEETTAVETSDNADQTQPPTGEVKEEAKDKEPPVEDKEEATDYSKITEIEDATKELEKKGFDYSELYTEWSETGDLSKETRAKLNAQGITDDVIDSYIEGRKAIVERTWDDIASVVGGREQMNKIVDWARANLSDAEKTAVDALRDPIQIKFALEALNNRMNDKEGILPQPVTGQGGDVQGDYFRSMAEVEEAINDPKYSKDEFYRQKVAQKISASREAGILELK